LAFVTRTQVKANMSFTTSLVKTAINCTPEFMMSWVANFVLKGIAEISAISFDLDARTAYVQATLNGEAEAIEVWLNGFCITSDDTGKYLLLNEARSNKPWLNNIFARITGKAWKIPALPQFQAYIDLVADLLKPEVQPEQ